MRHVQIRKQSLREVKELENDYTASEDANLRFELRSFNSKMCDVTSVPHIFSFHFYGPFHCKIFQLHTLFDPHTTATVRDRAHIIIPTLQIWKLRFRRFERKVE